MTIPGWYSILLLSAASWRSWKLLADDDILDWPRRRLLRLGTWKEEGDPVPLDYRRRYGEFLKCPYCAGFWIALGWWGGFQWSEHWSLVAAAPLALSALVGLAARVLPTE